MDKQLLISLQTTEAYKFHEETNEMVNQKRWDLAANRYYYACFHMVQAAFISRGISTKTHEGCLTELGKNFILTGELDKQFGRFFSRMIQLQIKSRLQ